MALSLLFRLDFILNCIDKMLEGYVLITLLFKLIQVLNLVVIYIFQIKLPPVVVQGDLELAVTHKQV